MPQRRPVRMAMIGGGPGSFIGPVHRMAAELDREIILVAGAFSSDPGRSRQAGLAWGLAEERCYPGYERLLTEERGRDDGAELVVIVTPNHLHAPITVAALQAGYHVVCDKPASATLAEAQAVARALAASDRLYALTFTYSGYPMLRQAREMVRGGALGAVRKVVVEYSQGWLAEAVEHSGNAQAEWRTDKARAGIGGCIADIGVHAFNALEFVTGQNVVEICADLSSVVPGRSLDDDCNVLLRLENGARGVLIASQITAGERNGMRLKVSGELGTLIWSHEDPSVLVLNWISSPMQVMHAGAPYLSAEALRVTRLPTGHPEGFIEAFANLYRDFASAVRGEPAGAVPSIAEGLRAQAFVETAVDASRRRAGWTPLIVEEA